jgi:alpha-D-xyloside xylohydrolase
MPILVREGSIVPLGPIVQSASENEDPLEIRVYSGKDASFEFYDDSGDGYSYENGARSTIPLHWDNSHRILSIGDRSGSFPSMPQKRSMHIVLVRAGHGVGADPSETVDRTLVYDGHHLNAEFGKER